MPSHLYKRRRSTSVRRRRVGSRRGASVSASALGSAIGKAIGMGPELQAARTAANTYYDRPGTDATRHAIHESAGYAGPYKKYRMRVPGTSRYITGYGDYQMGGGNPNFFNYLNKKITGEENCGPFNKERLFDNSTNMGQACYDHDVDYGTYGSYAYNNWVPSDQKLLDRTVGDNSRASKIASAVFNAKKSVTRGGKRSLTDALWGGVKDIARASVDPAYRTVQLGKLVLPTKYGKSLDKYYSDNQNAITGAEIGAIAGFRSGGLKGGYTGASSGYSLGKTVDKLGWKKALRKEGLGLAKKAWSYYSGGK